MNLPRDERNKEQSVILVGIIPGPIEPSLSLNSYLSPLVHKLKNAWESGMVLSTDQNATVTLRLALACVSCDLPASRKVSGFLGHNARLGCTKCLKEFDTPSLRYTDYSRYDRDSWTPRSAESHRHKCELILKENTKTNIRKKESEYGVRNSILLSLPYFDPIRFTVIDIIHNLYLGTGKRVMKLWIETGLLTPADLREVDDRTRTFCIPSGVGRLPVNIMSTYGGFKAEQWQTWITIYSAVVLKGVLPDNHLQTWLLFVHACCILGQRILPKRDILTADLLLLNYCKRFEQLYGKDKCTPNLHLHLHLKECLLDYGPAHAFWCFSFERYNGLLGSYHTNNKAIEDQIVRKFVNSQCL